MRMHVCMYVCIYQFVIIFFFFISFCPSVFMLHFVCPSLCLSVYGCLYFSTRVLLWKSCVKNGYMERWWNLRICWVNLDGSRKKNVYSFIRYRIFRWTEYKGSLSKKHLTFFVGHFLASAFFYFFYIADLFGICLSFPYALFPKAHILLLNIHGLISQLFQSRGDA